MTPKASLEMYFKVFDHEFGASLTVGHDADGLGLVEINGQDHYGGTILLAPSIALKLAEAMRRVAEDMMKEKA